MNTAPLSILSAVATLLPGQWTAKPYPHECPASEPRAYLVRADSLTLFVHGNAYGNKGKLAISLSPPRDSKNQWVTLYQDKGSGRLPVPEINVSETKTAAQIAADITRRLLPDSEVYFAKATDLVKQWDNASNAKDAAFNRLYSLAQEKTQGARLERYKEKSIALGNLNEAGASFGYGEINVNSGDSCELKLSSVHPDKMAKIIEALGALGF